MFEIPGMRPPQQDRSRRTVERVLAIGAEVFAERGYEGFTIGEVCRRAQVSTGAVYTRFENKDALVRAIHDHALTALSEQFAQTFSANRDWILLPTPSFVEQAVTVLIAHLRSHSDIVRAVVLRSAVDPVMRARGAPLIGFMADVFVARLLDRATEYPHDDPEDVARGVFGMAFEAISWDVAFGSEYRSSGALGPRPDERLPRVCRMLLLTPPD